MRRSPGAWPMSMFWDPERAASFYDEYGEREWTRFEDGRTPAPSLDVHLEHLRRYVRAGDRVLDVGAGPGRFTIELARRGADVVVADISPGQLELNKERVAAAGLEERVVERSVADVLDLSHWEDGSFDATVCFGGPLSYVVDRAEEGVEELVRTGLLSDEPDYGHLAMKLFRWSELEALLSRHGTIVAASAAGLLPAAQPEEPELREFLSRVELALADEPGALA